MFDFLLRPIKRNIGRDRRYYRMIDDMFGFLPHNIELYKLALIHKSASVQAGGRSVNNERLEFLGDAVIESVTSDYVFIAYPDYNEGQMTQLRSKIVSRQSLNEIACRIGLDACIISSSSVSTAQKHMFGDAFEAMMGAIYLDQGYNFVNRLLINKIYAEYRPLDEVDEEETDFKSRLIEWGQKNHHIVNFRTKNHSHGAVSQFRSTVSVGGIEVGHGIGTSKKEAEQNAAKSVARDLSDELCTRLLDRLDRLESSRPNMRPATKPNEKKQERQDRQERQPNVKAEESPVQEVVAAKEEVLAPTSEEKKVDTVEKPKRKVVRRPKQSAPAKEEQTATNETTTVSKEESVATRTVRRRPTTRKKAQPKEGEKQE